MAQSLNVVVPPFHVQSTAAESRDGFPYFPHHDSVSALWTQKWRPSCAAGIYPFADGEVQDFDPIFAELVRRSDDDPSFLNRPEDYAAAFMPTAENLARLGDRAVEAGNRAEARDLYLRAAAVYRIARFPINRSPTTQQAWQRGLAAYEKAAPLLDPPSVTISIPFTHADTAAGDTDADIAAYLRLPNGTRPESGWPVLLFICGLDAYRTDITQRTQQHLDRGYATLSFEIPGTGDCPAAPRDPMSPDRLMSSIIGWVVDSATRHGFDVAKILARGISTGGYYAFRVAHTHASELFAVVAQGGGSHHMFNARWIRAQNQMEYPFALADALAHKFGYREADLVDPVSRYAAEAHKFSLVESGLLDQPSCKLLVINGLEDSIFPIEDSFIVAAQGGQKDLLARGDRRHMGNPGADEILHLWLADAVAGRP